MDKISPKARSRNMSRIKSKNTGPEIALRKRLFLMGMRYRTHYRISGKPDIVFVKKRVSIFVNGCFWHGHGCGNDHTPKTKTEFWNEKIISNQERDKRNMKKLEKDTWKVIIVWECEIEKNLNEVTKHIKKFV